jgi:hypothetical protein
MPHSKQKGMPIIAVFLHHFVETQKPQGTTKRQLRTK